MTCLAFGDRHLRHAGGRRRLGQRRQDRAVAHPELQVVDPRPQVAALAVERRAQLEEEARRDDAVPGEDVSDLARARVWRDLDRHVSVRRAAERLKQLDQEPDQGRPDHQRGQRARPDEPFASGARRPRRLRSPAADGPFVLTPRREGLQMADAPRSRRQLDLVLVRVVVAVELELGLGLGPARARARVRQLGLGLGFGFGFGFGRLLDLQLARGRFARPAAARAPGAPPRAPPRSARPQPRAVSSAWRRASQPSSRCAAARESSLAWPPERSARRVVKRSSYSSTGTGSERSSVAANARVSAVCAESLAGQRQRQADDHPLRRRARPPAPAAGRARAVTPATRPARAASPARRSDR